MTKNRSKIEQATGKLISSIQKVWGRELGDLHAVGTEHVMNLAHDLLQAGTKPEIERVLDGKSIEEYLGIDWVQRHSTMAGSIHNFKKELL